MSTLKASDLNQQRFGTLRGDGTFKPPPPPKPSHLHSVSVRARPSASTRPSIIPPHTTEVADGDDRPVSGAAKEGKLLIRGGLVQQRLAQFGDARGTTRSDHQPIAAAVAAAETGLLWSSSEDERELEVDEARWEAERRAVRLERARRRAEVDAAVRARAGGRESVTSFASMGSSDDGGSSDFGTLSKATAPRVIDDGDDDHTDFAAAGEKVNPVPSYYTWSLLRGQGPQTSTLAAYSATSLRRRKNVSNGRSGENGDGGSRRSTLKIAKPRTRKVSAQRAMAVEALFAGQTSSSMATAEAEAKGGNLASNEGNTMKLKKRSVESALEPDQRGQVQETILSVTAEARPPVDRTHLSPTDAEAALPSSLAPPSDPTPDLAAAHRLSTLSFLTAPLPAIASHTFTPSPLPPEAVAAGATAEIGFEEGDRLVVVVEDVGGGWSLGYREGSEARGDADGEGEGRVGLIPRGWYEFIEDLVNSPAPQQPSARKTSSDSRIKKQAVGWTPSQIHSSSPLASVLPPQMLSEMAAAAAQSPSTDGATPLDPVTKDSQGPVDVEPPSVSLRASDAMSFWRATLGPSATAKLRSQLNEATSSAPPSPAKPSSVENQSKAEASSTTKLKRPEMRNRQVSTAGAIGAWLTGRSKRDAAEKSGARSYIMQGTPPSPPSTDINPKHEEAQDGSEADDESNGNVSAGNKVEERYEVDEGSSWRAKVPLFAVQVHSPNTRLDDRNREHTVFSVTSTFWGEAKEGREENAEDITRVTVERRYSQFERLAQVLAARYSGIVLPSLPEKQFAGRFGAIFLESRRRGLERYLTRLIRHPLLRSSEPLIAFLSLDNDAAHNALFKAWLAEPSDPGAFFAKVWHPEWNVDREEALREVERCGRFVRAVEAGGGVADVEYAVARVRSSMQELSHQLNDLSKAILRLSAGMTLPPPTPRPDGDNDGDDDHVNHDSPDALGALRKRARAEAMQTADGAWCWRQGCLDCLAMTKALQATGVSISSAADLYRHCSEEAFAPLQELVKECSTPQRQHNHLFDLHRATLEESTADEPAEVESRRDTVLNVTMSEIERYHAERSEDFCDMAERILDEQLDLHQRAYDCLKTCRHMFSDANYAALASSPREPNSEELALASQSSSKPSAGSSILFSSWRLANNGPASPSMTSTSMASTLWTRTVSSNVPTLRDLFG